MERNGFTHGPEQIGPGSPQPAGLGSRTGPIGPHGPRIEGQIRANAFRSMSKSVPFHEETGTDYFLARNGTDSSGTDYVSARNGTEWTRSSLE